MAEQESRTISSNIKWAWQRKFQNGDIILNTGIMMGYKKTGETDEDGHEIFEINEEEGCKVAKSLLDDVNDWFDMASVRVSNEDKEKVTINARVNLKAMKYWAIQYCPYVEVISPVDLRKEIRQTLYKAVKKYNS